MSRTKPGIVYALEEETQLRINIGGSNPASRCPSILALQENNAPRLKA